MRRVIGLLAAAPLCPAIAANSSDAAAAPVAHVRLSLSHAGRVVVAWSAAAPPGSAAPAGGAAAATTPCVRHVPDGGNISLGRMSPAATQLQWRGRLWSAAEVDGLVEDAPYVYQCSRAPHCPDPAAVGGRHRGERPPGPAAEGLAARFGPQMRLRAPPAAAEGPGASAAGAGRGSPAGGRPVRLAILGDLAANGEGAAVVARILAGPLVSAALQLGDLAGNLSDEAYRRGDSFLQMIQPLASAVPYMTLPGDRDDLDAYSRFFRMPSVGSDPWYSFVLGPARFVMLWTEALADLSEKRTQRQMAWLRDVLERFGAGEERWWRPWLIVAGHRPLYCSMQQPTCGPEALRLRRVLEPLLQRHHVDLYLSAHLHAYERTSPVANGSLCPDTTVAGEPAALGDELDNACAPVYIVNGDAGTPPLEYETLPARWTARRHPGAPGHGELTLHNRTHLQYRQVGAAAGAMSDEFWLTKPEGGEEKLSAEEDFLEAISWLAFATAVVTGTCSFVRWAHADGLKRRDEALHHLRVELAVLSGLPSKVLGSAREVEHLVRRGGDSEGVGIGALH